MSDRIETRRRRWSVRFLLIPAALSMLVLNTATGVAGQEATPTVGTAVDPALCQVEPRSAALFEALAATPGVSVATPAPPAAGATPFVVPAGEPADAATVAAITETFREQLACVNADDYPRVFAFVTDDYGVRLAESGLLENLLALMRAEPRPLAEGDYARLVDVRDVIVLPDGRVGAILEAVFPQESPEPVAAHAVFVREGDRFLFDDLVEGIDVAATGE